MQNHNNTTYTTTSSESLRALGERVAKRHQTARLFLLQGPLGAGKTTFAQGLLKGFGVTRRVVSPTFTLINMHRKKGSQKSIAHIDFYRIKKHDELWPLGIYELLNDTRNTLVVEWSDRFPNVFMRFDRVVVKISVMKNARKISVRRFSHQRLPAPMLRAASRRSPRR